IPDWLRLTVEGRLKEAYEVSASTNTFPEICGRICPQDRLCEGNCVIEKDFGSVTIGSIERYITENAFANEWVEAPAPDKENGMSVAIIGAGPAGLAAADILRRKGYGVEIYDRYDRVGGLLIYGIPSFKLEKEVVERRRKLFEKAGIKFTLNCEIGKDIDFAEIRKKHNAILIATGVYKARDVELPENSLNGIYSALDYLTASNRIGLGDKVEQYYDGSLNAYDKHVVVIGGGDTAMDCVRTAIRQGAKKVSCLYRRDKANMPGSVREVKNAEEEGVEFIWLAAPKAFVGNNGKVEQILAEKMRLASQDGGRAAPVVIENSQFALKSDMVIKALGFEPEDLPKMFAQPELEVSRNGTLKIDSQQMTSLDRVFAAGDIARGASLVVWAIKDGREAAETIDRRLSSSN
ncbi:MAG: NAD(P)-dependent oxidoreductase, partial [Pseudomonadota bacterium]